MRKKKRPFRTVSRKGRKRAAGRKVRTARGRKGYRRLAQKAAGRKTKRTGFDASSYNRSYDIGFDEAYNEGYNAGYQEGLRQGYEEEYKEGA